MRRMYSENQIQEVVQKGFDEEKINPSKVLYGKFVRIIQAPSSTTLTDEQITVINEGVFINGTFLGFKNPVLFPSYELSTELRGVLISQGAIRMYSINKSTNVISLVEESQMRLNLGSVFALNGKAIPAYPSSTGTFTLKSVDGTLTWVEDE